MKKVETQSKAIVFDLKKKEKKRNGGYLDGSVAVGRIERSAEEGGAAGSAGSSGRRRRRLDAFGPAAFGSAALLRQPPPHNQQEKKKFSIKKKNRGNGNVAATFTMQRKAALNASTPKLFF